MARLVEYNATLEHRFDLTDALAIFRFRTDAALPPAPWFVPGQYCVIGLNNPAHPELGSTQRRMSIASSSQERSSIEFYIRYVRHPTSDNPLTHLLWTLAEGDRAYVRATPKGNFTLQHHLVEGDRRLKLFVAAGTGLAPFVCMVRSQVDPTSPHSLDDFALVHGASYPEELGYRSELQAHMHHGLRYRTTVSRPDERPSWRGLRGRVEDLFLPDRLAATEAQLGLASGELRPERVAVFVCGLQGTIGRCIERLAQRGYVPDDRKLRQAFEVDDERPASLFYEQYDTDPVLDLSDTALVQHITTSLRAAP